MSDDPDEATGDDHQRRQLRLLGVGTAAAGLLAIVAASVSTKPHGILVFGLGGLGVVALVLERTQGADTGLSLGFLTAGLLAWAYPLVSTSPDYRFFGVLLVVLGLVNALGTPVMLYLQRLGERLADRGGR